MNLSTYIYRFILNIVHIDNAYSQCQCQFFGHLSHDDDSTLCIIVVIYYYTNKFALHFVYTTNYTKPDTKTTFKKPEAK